MQKPILRFKKQKNSFCVKVTNLEKLSVIQIQQLQKFVHQRKGVFDFGTYEFIIQKRLEFDEFKYLLTQSEIVATVTEHIIQSSNHPRVGFGQYKGMFYSDIPSSYLIWLKSNYFGYDRGLLDDELLKRRLN